MESKPFYLSKTFLFGALSVVVGVAGLFGYADFIPGDDAVQILEVVNGIIIIVLRFLTNQPISVR